jgi:hypothetical protein
MRAERGGDGNGLHDRIQQGGFERHKANPNSIPTSMLADHGDVAEAS